jgi:hypothetical protein
VGQLSGMGGGGFGGPPWLCGKAWSAVVWRSIGGGLEKKMATTLVLQRGGGAGWGFYKGPTQWCCARNTPPILSPIRTLSQGFSVGFKEGGNLHRLQFGSIQVMIGVTSTRGRVYNSG